ncbi:MAG: type II secretion system F family protein [Patescibacteria group bacterium]
MKFKYSARTKEGELQVGFVEAPIQNVAADILAGHNLLVLSLEREKAVRSIDKIIGFFNRVKLTDIMIFTRQFAILLESDVPLGDSIRNLHKQTKNQFLKEIIYEISNDINAGLSLSQSLERQNRIFSDFYLNMIKSAEVTGRLEEAMVFLADYLEKEVSWRSKVRNAMIYPLFIISLFSIVVIILLTVVFPKLAPVFEESNTKLPLPTKILLNSGNFMLDWWWVIISILVMVIFLIIEYFKTAEGKNVINELTIRMPILGDLFKKIYIARFAESLSVLIKGGIPITQAIEISSHNIGNIAYRDILHNIAESVRAGELFSSLIAKNEYYFPSLVGQMVAIGESTGRLEEILSKISIFYTREVDNILNNLSELIQPILISVIGVFVGLLFATILIPIYNLAQGFKM